MPTPPTHQTHLDTSGLYCPEPIMLLHGHMDQLDAGQILLLTATDPASVRDVNKFCHFLGHALVHQQTAEAPFQFWIQKKPT